MASGTITSWQIEEENAEIVIYFLFLGSKSLQMMSVAMKSEDDCFWEGKLWQTYTVCWKVETWLPTKVPGVKAVVFPVVMYGCESWTIKEGRTPKNWCLQTVVLEKTSESPLDSKGFKQINLKGNQPWILIGRTNAEAEVPVFWSSDVNSWLIGKVPDARKAWGQKVNTVLQDDMARWYHWCNWHKLGQTLGDGWGTGRPGVLQSMRSQKVGYDWVTEQQPLPSISPVKSSHINPRLVNPTQLPLS